MTPGELADQWGDSDDDADLLASVEVAERNEQYLSLAQKNSSNHTLDRQEEKKVENVENVEVKVKADCESYEGLGLTPPSQEHEDCLRDQFGLRTFKPLQWKIIRGVMEDRRDQCVVMSTGYGKSLCYQYQAVKQDTTVIVISPLISLMEDQVLSLQSSGIPAAFLGSAQSNPDQVLEQLARGKLNVLYVTPEFITASSKVILERISRDQISCIAVDEAHCVSQVSCLMLGSYFQIPPQNNIMKLFCFSGVTTFDPPTGSSGPSSLSSPEFPSWP